MTKSTPEQIPEPKRDVLFMPIVERLSENQKPVTNEPRKKVSLFAQKRAANQQQDVKAESFPSTFAVY